MLDQITVFGIISLINCFTCLFIGSFLYLKNRKSHVNFSYFAFDACIAFYAFFYFLWQSSSDLKWGIVFFKWCIVGVVLINSAFVQFAFVLLGINREYKKQLAFVHLVNAFYCYAALFLFYDDWKVKYSYGLWPIPSGVFHTYIIWWFSQVIYCFNLVYKKGILLSEGKAKKQYQWIFWATLIAYTGGATNWLVWYNINFPPYLNSGIAIYTIVLAYAIFRHQLLGIDVIVKKTLVFAGLASFVFGAFAVATFLVKEVSNRYFPLGSTYANFLSIFIVIIGYEPIRKFLVNATDRFLFQKKSNYAKVLRETSKDIALATSLSELTRKIIAVLIRKARTKNVAVFIRSEHNDHLELRGCYGYGGKDARPEETIRMEGPLINCLSQRQSPLTRLTVEEEIISTADKIHRATFNQVLEIFKVLKAEVIVPSFMGASTKDSKEKHSSLKLQSVLVLGAKKSDEDYYEEDLDMLATLAQEHAITFENVRLFDEVLIEREARVQAQSQAKMGAFAKSIAHEIKNALAGLYGPAQFMTLYGYEDLKKKIFEPHLIGKLPSNTEKKFLDILERMKQEGDKILSKSDEIRTIALTVQGTLSSDEEEFGEFDFKVVWDAAVVAAKPGHYKLTRNVTERVRPFGNVVLIQRVLVNLINNAAEAMHGQKNSEIVFRGSYQEIEGKKVASFEFSDNGPGISKEICNRIFDQGFSTKPKPKSTDIEAPGHGQGLWVCRHVIEEIHKGKIWVESELGQGTVFKFWLPLVKTDRTS